MAIYKKIFAYVPEAKGYGYLSLLLSVASAAGLVAGYYFVYCVMVALIQEGNVAHAMALSIRTMMTLTAGSVLYFASGVASHKLGFRVETNLRKKGIDGVTKASFRFFDLNPSGVVRKTIDDNAGLTHQSVAHMIPDLGQAFVVPILSLILGFYVSIRLGIVLVVLIVIGGLLFKSMMGGETKFMQIYQDALKRMSAETVEYIRGIQVVKIFGADVQSFKALHDAIHDYAKYAYAYSKSCKLPYTAIQWLLIGVIAIVMVPLSLYLHRVGDMRSFYVELIMLLFISGVTFSSLMRIMYSSMYIFNANYALSNLEKMYDDMLKDKIAFGTKETFDGEDIAFSHVDFGYGDKPVFKDFNLNLERGKTYALIGASGSGKSTLAKLLSGFYKIDGGDILIGGTPLSDYSEKAVAENIAFIFQDPKLFNGSIFDNIAVAKKGATEDEVLKALKDAASMDIIENLPDGIHTLIGAKGVYLSGGEKQRIAIARAMLKDAKIVVMDEASAAIDADNEYKLQASFKKLMEGKTVIMIAHRLTSVRNVDEILVMEKGKVVERGSHDVLMAKDSYYKRELLRYNMANDWRINDERAL
nr:ABC transporter ATP-binding protein [uncultured Peptoniphilus sp.]